MTHARTHTHGARRAGREIIICHIESQPHYREFTEYLKNIYSVSGCVYIQVYMCFSVVKNPLKTRDCVSTQCIPGRDIVKA